MTNIIYTKITEVNLSAFVYRPFYEALSSNIGTYTEFLKNEIDLISFRV